MEFCRDACVLYFSAGAQTSKFAETVVEHDLVDGDDQNYFVQRVQQEKLSEEGGEWRKNNEYEFLLRDIDRCDFLRT